MAAVPEDEVLQMASGNAAVVHGIDVEQLQPLAGRFGPAPELVARPLSPPGWTDSGARRVPRDPWRAEARRDRSSLSAQHEVSALSTLIDDQGRRETILVAR
jgi:hypothetical protein